MLRLGGLKRSAARRTLRVTGDVGWMAPYPSTATKARIAAFQICRLAVLTQVGSRLGYFQLKLAVGRYGELGASAESFVVFASRQFHVEAAGNHVHHFQLAGAELVIARRHDADGGRACCHVEGDGFDGAVEVLVDLEHLENL